MICVHFYLPPEQLSTRIREAQHWGRLYGKPVIMNEFVGRPRQPFERAMPIVAERKIGWCFWELMIGRRPQQSATVGEAIALRSGPGSGNDR